VQSKIQQRIHMGHGGVDHRAGPIQLRDRWVVS
jgi:hypothetical protein